jgi:hypothetical protein
LSNERGFKGFAVSRGNIGTNNSHNVGRSEAAEIRLVKKRKFAAPVGMFLTVGAPEEMEASSKDPVAFTVAGKISNRGSQTRTDISNGLQELMELFE